jgi:hypothetical protein
MPITVLRLWPMAALLSLGFLTGCQETGTGTSTGNLVKARAPDVPVSIIAVDGLPDAIGEQVETALAESASARGLVLVEPKDKPRYEIKGYFSAGRAEAGTALSFAWDVLDTRSKEALRVEGEEEFKRQPDDPWAVIDGSGLPKLANGSMNSLAAFIAARETGAEPAAQ